MIKAENIYKNYGDLEILKGVNLEINSGEIVSIVGPSGAGKTTLLQILGTLDRPNYLDKSALFIKETNVLHYKEKQMATFRNKNIGFIFQFHQLLPEFTALENVCIPAFIGGKKLNEIEDRAMELLDFLEISHRAKHKPSAMSGGEQQRVAVARALINNPSVVFADEPSGNLDSKNAKILHDLFFKLRDSFNQTFVIVTHNNELASSTDRKLVMKDGKLVQ